MVKRRLGAIVGQKYRSKPATGQRVGRRSFADARRGMPFA
jgi:hypothetical protein